MDFARAVFGLFFTSVCALSVHAQGAAAASLLAGVSVNGQKAGYVNGTMSAGAIAGPALCATTLSGAAGTTVAVAVITPAAVDEIWVGVQGQATGFYDAAVVGQARPYRLGISLGQPQASGSFTLQVQTISRGIRTAFATLPVTVTVASGNGGGGGGTIAAPAAPTSLTATAQNDAILGPSVVVSWTDTNNDFTGFGLERGVGTGPLLPYAVFPATQMTFTDKQVNPTGSYTYALVAFNQGVAGPATQPVSVALNFGGGPGGGGPGAPPTPPAAPTLVSVTTTGLTVTVTWTDTNNDFTGFVLVRAAGNGQPAPIGGLLPSTQFSYTDNQVAPNTSYLYAVFAVNQGGESQASQVLQVTTGAGSTNPRPATPTNLTATITGNAVTLKWVDAANDFDGFGILRGTSPANLTPIKLIGPAPLTWTDFQTNPNTTYYYAVVATSNGQQSLESNVVMVKTQTNGVGQLATPTGLTASATPTSVSLSWRDTASDFTGFQIMRSTGGGAFVLVGQVTGFTFMDKNVQASTTYTYEIIAVNNGGGANNGARSQPASITVKTPALPKGSGNPGTGGGAKPGG